MSGVSNERIVLQRNNVPTLKKASNLDTHRSRCSLVRTVSSALNLVLVGLKPHEHTVTNWEDEAAERGLMLRLSFFPSPLSPPSRSRCQSVRCFQRTHWSPTFSHGPKVMMLKLPVEETKMSNSDMTFGPLKITPAGRRRGQIRQRTHEHQNHGEVFPT